MIVNNCKFIANIMDKDLKNCQKYNYYYCKHSNVPFNIQRLFNSKTFGYVLIYIPYLVMCNCVYPTTVIH